MIRINLLPHREERRKAQRRQLGMLAVGVACVGIALALLIHGVMAGYLSVQNDPTRRSSRATPVLTRKFPKSSS